MTELERLRQTWGQGPNMPPGGSLARLIRLEQAEALYKLRAEYQAIWRKLMDQAKAIHDDPDQSDEHDDLEHCASIWNEAIGIIDKMLGDGAPKDPPAPPGVYIDLGATLCRRELDSLRALSYLSPAQADRHRLLVKLDALLEVAMGHDDRKQEVPPAMQALLWPRLPGQCIPMRYQNMSAIWDQAANAVKFMAGSAEALMRRHEVICAINEIAGMTSAKIATLESIGVNAHEIKS